LKLTGRDARGRLGWNEIMRLFTLVLLHLLLQNGIFNSTHSYSLLHIHYSRIRIPSYLSFTAHTKYFNPPPLSSGFSPPPQSICFSARPLRPGDASHAEHRRGKVELLYTRTRPTRTPPPSASTAASSTICAWRTRVSLLGARQAPVVRGESVTGGR
jgi:hypothetical protein